MLQRTTVATKVLKMEKNVYYQREMSKSSYKHQEVTVKNTGTVNNSILVNELGVSRDSTLRIYIIAVEVAILVLKKTLHTHSYALEKTFKEIWCPEP